MINQNEESRIAITKKGKFCSRTTGTITQSLLDNPCVTLSNIGSIVNWAADFSNNRCARTIFTDECLSIDRAGAVLGNMGTNNGNWSFIVYYNSSYVGQYIYWKGVYKGQTSTWTVTFLNHADGFKYYHTGAFSTGSDGGYAYWKNVCRSGNVLEYKLFSTF